MKRFCILILLFLFHANIFPKNYAIFIPDNPQTNVFCNEVSFVEDDDLFNNAVLFIKKCLNLLNIDCSELSIDKKDFLSSRWNDVLTLLVDDNFFSFYQEGLAKRCGRRALFRDLEEYETIFVFENPEKFEKYKAFKRIAPLTRLYCESYINKKIKPLPLKDTSNLKFSEKYHDFVFCCLDLKNIIFLPKEYYSDFLMYEDDSLTLNIQFILRELEIINTPREDLLFSLLPGDFNSSTDDVRIKNLSFLDYLSQHDELIELLPEFKIYQEGGGAYSGRHRLILDLKQKPYFFNLYSFESEEVFKKKIPWFSGFNLDYFNQFTFFK